jgi:hypothetical protein
VGEIPQGIYKGVRDMNYWEYVQSESKEKSVLDESYNTHKTYVIKCIDGENSLLELLKYIKANGNGGHSFEIVVDPNSKDNKKSFFWDGDGSDRITEIVRVKTGKESELISIMRATLNQIKKVAFNAGFTAEGEQMGEVGLREKLQLIYDITKVIEEGEKSPSEKKLERIEKEYKKVKDEGETRALIGIGRVLAEDS